MDAFKVYFDKRDEKTIEASKACNRFWFCVPPSPRPKADVISPFFLQYLLIERDFNFVIEFVKFG